MSHAAHAIRYLCSELVSVLYEDRFLILNQLVANLEEISSDYATLLVEQPLQRGAAVSLHAKGHDLNGFVASSEYHPTLGWFVEIKLDPNSQWSPQLFSPAHSVPLSELIYAAVTAAA